MAVHPGRKATGNRWFRQFPHWIHSTCVNQHRFLFNSFFDAEDSLGVVTCFMSPTKFGTQRSVAGRSISDQKCWIGWWLAVATLISQKRNLPLSAVPCGRWKSPNSCVACGCVASSHERQHPHPTQPKKLRSMRMCCKFSRTSTSPPHPTQPKKLRSMRMCCKFSRTSTSPPHPTQEVT